MKTGLESKVALFVMVLSVTNFNPRFLRSNLAIAPKVESKVNVFDKLRLLKILVSFV